MEDGMNCPLCNSSNYHTETGAHPYEECGLPYVTLSGVTLSKCTDCGDESVSIPRMAELHRLLAFIVATRSARLKGCEVRFLRKYLGWSAAQFAECMGATTATVSRWECSAINIGQASDRLLRMFVLRAEPIDKYPNEEIKGTGRETEKKREPLQVSATEGGWRRDVSEPLHY